jgi:hypothetical protein
MSVELDPRPPMPALVCRGEARQGLAASYLVLSEVGAADWTQDPRLATAFASMREAARAALRLPAALRAYGLPRDPEMALH